MRHKLMRLVPLVQPPTLVALKTLIIGNKAGSYLRGQLALVFTAVMDSHTARITCETILLQPDFKEMV